ncbi:uncharacterized protein conserved in bacteria [Hahella chejuensis KCTC 2396]|uniref:Uncharacterized protein conserved in bacteria n=1 Tax=Hahella chejuensis (strain KCTC 2396) TaxID=349521 RepID=Q2SD13_HAHCH|nr:DUF924 family protein [Hahella chejuensis]ABC31461.1 uncharacterized protein conserved in bacteria [Hahella chejuensis KCTC 2396]
MWSDSEILRYWFGELDENGLPSQEILRRWFADARSYDREIRRRFLTTVVLASEQGLQHWRDSSDGVLALILLQDVFPRYIFRGGAMAFEQDREARKTAREGLDKALDVRLEPVHRIFFYMPLIHSEKVSDQEESVALYQQLAATCEAGPLRDFVSGFASKAETNQDVIRQFGRFPHRNKILKRASRPEEVEFLASCPAVYD